MKTFRNSISILAAAVMLFVLLTGCGAGAANNSTSSTTTSNSKSSTGKQKFIAYLGSDTGSTDNVIFANSMKALSKLAGLKVVFTPDTTYDDDSTISFVQNQIAAGASGLVFSPSSDAILLTVMNLCEEAKVYWAIDTRSISDQNVKKKVEASKYYVGNSYEDEYKVAYNVMTQMHALGYKKFAIISTAKGNSAIDTREQAIAKASKDFGMSIVGEARDFTQASEITVASQSFLAAYKDLDAIFIVGTYAEGAPAAAVKAIQDSGRGDKVKLVAIDYGLTQGIVNSMQSKILTLDVIGMQYDPFIVSSKVMNAILGTPIAPTNFQTPLGVTFITQEDVAKQWEKVYSDPKTQYMSQDEMKLLLKSFNPAMTVDSFNKFVNDWDPVANRSASN